MDFNENLANQYGMNCMDNVFHSGSSTRKILSLAVIFSWPDREGKVFAYGKVSSGCRDVRWLDVILGFTTSGKTDRNGWIVPFQVWEFLTKIRGHDGEF